MSNNDLQALFANIKAREPSHSGVQPSTSNVSPPPPPWSKSPPANANAATAQSLLNLLNFGSTTASTPPAFTSTPTSQKPETARSVSAADLLARFKNPAGQQSSNGVQSDGTVTQDSSNSAENALLKLLNKSNSTQSSRTPSADMQQVAPQNDTPIIEPRAADASTIQQPKPIFTYSNPFEALNASRKATPSATTPQPKASSSTIFTTPAVDRTASPSDLSVRKKLTPRSASAKVERLARENSVRSNGTPEPVIKEESPAPKMEDIPIRTTKAKKVEESNKPAKPTGRDVQQEQLQEKATIASKEVDWEPTWEPTSKESPAAAADEWEDADESPNPEEGHRKVPVFNFPIRPFISISMNLGQSSSVGIREGGLMEISRLKKEFDQHDRSLAAATTKYIGYALVKNGGMRIIRQDDGSDRQVFKHSHDRVFNVAFCTTALNAPPSEHQAILGTGISGTVYYATVSKEGNDLFEKNELDSETLSFPPWPPADENSAGGQLKTRAKRSSRHPEYFAVGRGKSIHIIWPATAMFAKYSISDSNRQVDMELLYQERNLQIATGKAGKDFIFSEDDSTIISLDKTGRLRFWDIRPLTDESNATVGKVTPIKIDSPLLSLMTASPSEKSWPTSVLLVDKSRPYLKGGAQRYVLVGFRQNHTLQLWDIALGKAVQELNFPHESETDGVCSVNYHPGSGFIVVGHPTRNSLFFIHLSAPRYAMSSSVDQADYVSMVASKDPDVPKPESTACMSGIREISFASKGELRSVELLPIHKASMSTTGEKAVTDALFELYVAHSRGVTCLTITKEDLGLDANSKVTDGVDAIKAGLVVMKDLKLGSIVEESTRSRSPTEDQASSAGKSSKKKSKKTQQPSEEIEIPVPAVETPAMVLQPAVEEKSINGDLQANGESLTIPKETKKSKKKVTQEQSKTPSRTASPVKPEVPMPTVKASVTPVVEALVAPPVTARAIPESVQDVVGATASSSDLKQIEQSLSKEFKKELHSLYKDIQNDRIVQDSTSSARQEAVLRLVSQTLTTNVEKTIATIVGTQIQQVVVPAVNNVTSQAIQSSVSDAVAQALKQTLSQELGKHIPSALQNVLTSSQFVRAVQDAVSQKLSKNLESQITDIINRNVVGSVSAAANKAAAEVESRMAPIIARLEDDRRQDRERQEKSNVAIASMVETLESMSATQVAFQNQILHDRQQLAVAAENASRQTSAQVTAPPGPIAKHEAVKPKSEQELEQDRIAALMSEGRYEEASIMWIQSTYQDELFDIVFVRFTPEYLSTDVSALVAFTIAITVSRKLDSNTERRLEWVSAAMDCIDWRDPEMAELSAHAPQLLDGIIGRVEGLYMTLAEENSHNPIIKLIPPVARKARDLRTALKQHGAGAQY